LFGLFTASAQERLDEPEEQVKIPPLYRERISFSERSAPRWSLGPTKLPPASAKRNLVSRNTRNTIRVSRGSKRQASLPTGEVGSPPNTPLIANGQSNHAQGIASYYSFKGGMRAASLLAPMGASVKVTNMETGQSIVVVISDRGPFVKGRVIDLEKDAFKALFGSTSRGLGRVSLEW